MSEVQKRKLPEDKSGMVKVKNALPSSLRLKGFNNRDLWENLTPGQQKLLPSFPHPLMEQPNPRLRNQQNAMSRTMAPVS